MKRTILALGIATALFSTSALAANSGVENALKKRADLSDFYNALVATGVANELNEGTRYTVFAPTNAAFREQLPQAKFPCLYDSTCPAETAEVIRNHIIPDEVYLGEAINYRGGAYSIGHRFVNIGEPSRNNYAVDGNNVIYTSNAGGVTLYKIDGVIANPNEMAALALPYYASNVVPYGNVVHSRTTTTERVINDPDCVPPGCPDAVTETTTVTRSLTPLTPSYTPAFAPY